MERSPRREKAVMWLALALGTLWLFVLWLRAILVTRPPDWGLILGLAPPIAAAAVLLVLSRAAERSDPGSPADARASREANRGGRPA